jgi:hypothetical protein
MAGLGADLRVALWKRTGDQDTEMEVGRVRWQERRR